MGGYVCVLVLHQLANTTQNTNQRAGLVQAANSIKHIINMISFRRDM